ncbi:MAG: hypothetical protein R3F49_13540 [Planctomycetota bacterium]
MLAKIRVRSARQAGRALRAPALLCLFAVAPTPRLSAQDCRPPLTTQVLPSSGIGGGFGSALALDSHTLLVAAPEPSESPTSPSTFSPFGRAEVFVVDSLTRAWVPDGVLVPTPHPQQSAAGFASSVALGHDSAGTLWAFCAWPDDVVNGNGTVRPFYRTNAGWIEAAPIVPPVATATGRFGVSIAFSGDLLAIGEAIADGQVHLAQRTGPLGWTITDTLTPGPTGNGTFGHSVAIGARTSMLTTMADVVLYVGDPGSLSATSGQGVVNVYEWTAGAPPAWVLASQRMDTGGAALDHFGWSLAARGEKLIIGERGVDVAGGSTGSATYYARYNAARERIPSPSAPHVVSGFGATVAVSHLGAFIGAPNDAIGGVTQGGAVYGRSRVANLAPNQPWSKVDWLLTMLPSTSQARAGTGLAVNDWVIAIGAPGAESVRVASLDPTRDVDHDLYPDACESQAGISPVCTALPNSTGRAARLHIEGDPTFLTGNLSLSVDRLPTQSFGYFIVSESTFYILPPGGSSVALCLNGAIGRYSLTVLNSGTLGTVHTTFGTGGYPYNGAQVPGYPGATWYFQYWHRDNTPSTVLSNMSECWGVTLR